MKPAFQTREALLKDIHAKRRHEDALHVWWLGQSGFLVMYQGRSVLFDPYLSDSLTHKYADSEKPHVRMTEQVIEPEALDFVDFVTSSHNHTDHLDADTLRPLFRVNPHLRIVAPEANRETVLERSGAFDAAFIGLNDGRTMTVDGFRFNGIAAAHNTLDTDAEGNHRFMGFVVEWGDRVLYHSGDSLLYPGLEERLRRFDIDLAFLPINGNRPERKVAGNFEAKEAVALAKSTNMAMVIPCHYDMFEFNTVSPREFILEAEYKDLSYRILKNGEGWEWHTG